MQYKHIIFDLDGTLIDTELAVLQSLQETLKEIQNKDYTKEELNFVLGIPGETALQKLNISDIENVKSVWEKKFKNHFSKIRLFPYVCQLISDLKSMGLKVGIITSKTRKEYVDDFIPFGLGGKIDISLCIDDYETPKPSSKAMKLYLEYAKINPQEAIYIGDTIYDYDCAKGASVDFGLAVWGCKSFKGIAAKYFFNSPEEIYNQLNNKLTNESKLISLAKELQFIGQVGETYTKDPFDLERFKRIREISAELINLISSIPVPKIKDLFCNETGFQTPKIDVRAAIVKDSKILLVEENNHTWSLPGGWVDVNESIKSSVKKEVLEEAGLEVVPLKLIAVQDRNLHNIPLYAYGIAKVFVLCEIIGGNFKENIETIKSDFFSVDNLPTLAEEKVNIQQISMCIRAANNKEWQTLFD